MRPSILRLRRAGAIDAPRWTLGVLLAFTGTAKLSAVFQGIELIAFRDGDGAAPSAFRATAGAIAVVEAALAGALVVAADWRRFLLPIAVVAALWAASLALMQGAGWRVEYCGCFGPTLRLDLTDHLLAIGGALALSLGSARRPRFCRIGA